jgi:uncharacterized membrane protein YoaK (UPF0700 family)
VGGWRVRTFITGTMTEFAEALVAAATSTGQHRASDLRRAVALFGVWFMYLLGGIVSGAAGVRWGVTAALFPIAGITIAMVVEIRRWRADQALASSRTA